MQTTLNEIISTENINFGLAILVIFAFLFSTSGFQVVLLLVFQLSQVNNMPIVRDRKELRREHLEINRSIYLTHVNSLFHDFLLRLSKIKKENRCATERKVEI